LLLAVVLHHASEIRNLLLRKAIKGEGAQLACSSVANAAATNPRDEEMIKAAIGGREACIDRTVHTLCSVGRFSWDVKQNLSLGMSICKAQRGVNIFKVACACCCWQFWWMAELAALDYIGLACALLTVTILALAAGVNLLGDRAIFAVEAGLWCSIGFAIMSTHPIYLNQENVQTCHLSIATVELQFISLIAMVVMDVYFYTGLHRRLCGFTYE